MRKKLQNNRQCTCDTDPTCCTGKKAAFHSASLETNEAARTVHEGRETLVIPLVMAKASVVMNDYLLPLEAMQDYAWNGVPVTVGHPVSSDGLDISASASPAVSEAYKVGVLFDSRLEGDKLKANAYIDIEKAEKVLPGLVAMLESNEPMDVSTGFFSEAVDKTGKLNGNNYVGVHTEVIPDHLALLPGEEGACSWEDGCGVRTNKNKLIIDRLLEAITIMKLRFNKLKRNAKPKPAANERGSDDERGQMVADLISQDSSPFVPNDEDGLRFMSDETLTKMRDAFCNEGEEPEGNEEDPEANEEDEPSSNEEDEEVVQEEEEEEKPSMNKRKGKIALNADDRAALAFARRSYTDHKTSLVTRITANSNMTEKQLKTFTVEQLETIASGMPETHVPTYMGQPVSVNSVEDDKEAEAMFANQGVLSIFQQRKAS